MTALHRTDARNKISKKTDSHALMNKLVLLAAWTACTVSVAGQTMARTVQTTHTPQVIPALQHWKDAGGRLQMPAQGSIGITRTDSARLYSTAVTLAADLKTMFGYGYRVTVADNLRDTDIRMTLASAQTDRKETQEEGYVLRIGRHVTITGGGQTGAFWATRSLLQMMHNQPEGLQKGTATDYPAYSSRGFMLDVGRKFFSMEFLKAYVRIMAFYKMNEFHLHLNDNGFVEFAGNDWNRAYSAFRLESERFPGLTARDGSYSKAEFRELQKTAAAYGVRIIPEIDLPAHSLAFTHYRPSLAATNREYGKDHLDLYKKEVYLFVDSLFDEYLGGPDPVFCGREVHIGTDEYNVKEAEQFRVFTNHCINLIKHYGKTPRLWGSLNQMKGRTAVDLKGTVVGAWNKGWMDLESALHQGAKVVNMCDELLYIVPAVNYYHDFLEHQWLYENWCPQMMDRHTCIAPNPNLAGAMFAVWNDRVGNGISQQDVHIRAFPAVQLLAEKLWKGEHHPHTAYRDFQALCSRTPEAPGVNLAARVDSTVVLTPPNRVITLSGCDTLATPITEIGYPYAVEFEIRPAAEPAIDAVLFQSPHAEFITNWNNTGKLAFRRDGYEFVFHSARLKPNTWTSVRIEGDAKGTTLIINGEQVERLEGRIGEVYHAKAKRKDRIWYQETLVFPLATIGHSLMGFKGEIRNVVCIPLNRT